VYETALFGLLYVTGLDRGWAQNTETKHRIGLVNEYTIKPGMMREYLEWAQKEARPLYLKAGIKEAYFPPSSTVTPGLPCTSKSMAASPR